MGERLTRKAESDLALLVVGDEELASTSECAIGSDRDPLSICRLEGNALVSARKLHHHVLGLGRGGWSGYRWCRGCSGSWRVAV